VLSAASSSDARKASSTSTSPPPSPTRFTAELPSLAFFLLKLLAFMDTRAAVFALYNSPDEESSSSLIINGSDPDDVSVKYAS